MKEFIKRNFAILLAFALPIILIIVVAVSTYLPSLFISTRYNFIYTTCEINRDYYYSCDAYLQKKYSVVDGKLAVSMVNPKDINKVMDVNTTYTSRIFLHDTQKNESREITEIEAKALTLNELLTSPDGVTVSSDYTSGGGDFFFIFGGGSSSYGHYLTKGNSKKKINLINDSDRYYYRDNFQFLGWVTPSRN